MRPTTIKQLATKAHLHNAFELAAYCGLDTQVVTEHWNKEPTDPSIKMPTLLKLLKLTSIRIYIDETVDRVLRESREELEKYDVCVSEESLDAALRRGVDVGDVRVLLEVTHDLLSAGQDADPIRLASPFSTFWSGDRGLGFEAAFAHPDRLINSPAVDALLIDLLRRLNARRNHGGDQKSRRICQVLTHWLCRAGLVDASELRTGRGRDVEARCALMGHVIAHDDIDAVEKYARRLDRDEGARSVERWIWPAWSGDISAGSDEYGTSHAYLEKTMREVVREVASDAYPPAYQFYVAEVLIPVAMETDERLGGSAAKLGATLLDRVEKTDMPSKVRRSMLNTAKSLGQ